MKLRNKVCIVTGAASGIGKEIAAFKALVKAAVAQNGGPTKKR